MGLGIFSSISKKRASTKIQQMKLQLATGDDQSDDLTKSEKELLKKIENILEEARNALDNGKTDLAWQLLHSAKRVQLKLDSKSTLAFKKDALFYEVDEKLKGWRKKQSWNI